MLVLQLYITTLPAEGAEARGSHQADMHTCNGLPAGDVAVQEAQSGGQATEVIQNMTESLFLMQGAVADPLAQGARQA